jgi:hypothetical protein
VGDRGIVALPSQSNSLRSLSDSRFGPGAGGMEPGGRPPMKLPELSGR